MYLYVIITCDLHMQSLRQHNLRQKDIRKTALGRSDIKTLASVCDKFTSLDLRIPVMSVYESTATKIHDTGPIGRFRAAERVVSSLFAVGGGDANLRVNAVSLLIDCMQPSRRKTRSL